MFKTVRSMFRKEKKVRGLAQSESGYFRREWSRNFREVK